MKAQTTTYHLQQPPFPPPPPSPQIQHQPQSIYSTNQKQYTSHLNIPSSCSSPSLPPVSTINPPTFTPLPNLGTSPGLQPLGPHMNSYSSPPIYPHDQITSHPVSYNSQQTSPSVASRFTPLSSTGASSTPASNCHSTLQPPSSVAHTKVPKMPSPRNSKRDIHAPDFAYEVKYKCHPISPSLTIPPEQAALVPKSLSDIVMKKYATSVDERNFLTVYEYKINNQWIMWDYYTGYVHLTGLWKALGNNKADIVKLIDNSPDLEPLIRRVRGGYLKIQGTWLPYEVARALAARTCYHIRYALISIFGETFPECCLQPFELGFGQLQLHSSTTTKRRRRRTGNAAASNTSTVATPLYNSQTESPSPSFLLLSSPTSNSSNLTSADPLPTKRSMPDLSTTTYNCLKRQPKWPKQNFGPAASAVASPPINSGAMAPPPPLSADSAPYPFQNSSHSHYHQYHGQQQQQQAPASVSYTSPSLALSSPSMFHVSPQRQYCQSQPYAECRSESSSQSDTAYFSDDDEPLHMTYSGSASSPSMAMVASAAIAKSRRASSSSSSSSSYYHHQYQYRTRSRVFSASTTPNSSLPNSPLLMDPSIPPSQPPQHQVSRFQDPLTPPPSMPLKLPFPEESVLTESTNDFVQALQATRSLLNLASSPAGAPALANKDINNVNSCGIQKSQQQSSNGLEGGSKIWAWNGNEKLDSLVGNSKQQSSPRPRVLLPPPGSAPRNSSPWTPHMSVAPSSNNSRRGSSESVGTNHTVSISTSTNSETAAVMMNINRLLS